MPKYRKSLPQLKDRTYLTDGGLETTLIFHDGLDLPDFAAFVLLDRPDGRAALDRYYDRYLGIAERAGSGFILDSVTWRANPDWGRRLGYDHDGLRRINRDAIDHLAALRARWGLRGVDTVVSGAIGPRGDGYKAGRMDAAEAADYHAFQIETFAATDADMVTAFTMNTIEEATGIAIAARRHAMPCAISFTVETDGRLVTGATLQQAIETVDRETGGYPAYYMINCAHPVHFEQALRSGAPWVERIRGVRANASTRSHRELDESDTLDAGDPADLGRRYAALVRTYPRMRVLGGCCGTDHRHVEAICEACVPVPASAG